LVFDVINHCDALPEIVRVLLVTIAKLFRVEKNKNIKKESNNWNSICVASYLSTVCYLSNKLKTSPTMKVIGTNVQN